MNQAVKREHFRACFQHPEKDFLVFEDDFIKGFFVEDAADPQLPVAKTGVVPGPPTAKHPCPVTKITWRSACALLAKDPSGRGIEFPVASGFEC